MRRFLVWLGRHLLTFREAYILLPVVCCMPLASVWACLTLTGRPPVDGAEQLWGMSLNMVGLGFVIFLVGFCRTRGHLLPDAPDDAPWQYQAVEGLCTLGATLLFIAAIFSWHR